MWTQLHMAMDFILSKKICLDLRRSMGLGSVVEQKRNVGKSG